jgi:hypothetical protein
MYDLLFKYCKFYLSQLTIRNIMHSLWTSLINVIYRQNHFDQMRLREMKCIFLLSLFNFSAYDIICYRLIYSVTIKHCLLNDY